MKKIFVILLSCAFLLMPIQNVNAFESVPSNRGINLECELYGESKQEFEILFNDEKFLVTVEEVPKISTFDFGDVTLGSSFNKKISISNGILTGTAYFTGTSNSTKGTISNVIGATLTGPVITGVTWDKRISTYNGGSWGLGQAIFSYSFIFIGGSASMTLQLTAKPNGRGVIALF